MGRRVSAVVMMVSGAAVGAALLQHSLWYWDWPLIGLTAALMQRFRGDAARELAAAFACLKAHAALHQGRCCS
jgi:hypothetical protein